MQFSRYILDWSLSAIRKLNFLNSLITGKNQLSRTALPCWLRLTHSSHSDKILRTSQASPLSPPIKMCPFYVKHSFEWFFLLIRHPPALPYRLQYSTIGRLGLNRRVRDGNGCVPQTHRHRKSLNLFIKDSTVSKTPYFFFLRKEVIQPHLPIRLPCYDFTPVIRPAFGGSFLAVRSPTSGISDSHGVTGGVYKTRERIHRGILIRDY